ncbi:YaaL family protein [Gracilibacillus sp. YIM 98692]|uniref:YaaL family protein n=1 Tax=Gracilibacillus sp. YIM 98692 TaxID=2663532 RepID=UPI0013CFA7A4|nr:YaaL family protein [Gracilibacillus sp. YIM 98692]
MLRSKKKVNMLEKEILKKINHLKSEWKSIEAIMDRSIEPSELGQYDLTLTKMKYLYLLREAKVRNLSALHTKK